MNGDHGTFRPRVACAVLGMVLAALPVMAARAGVSPQDGYGPDGAYQAHVELDLYAWLPATAGNVALGRGADVAVSQGVPSVSELANVLTGAFMGSALVRYGPWSGVLDIEHVGLSQTTALPPGRLGAARSLTTDVTMTRVAPGIGYQVYNGPLGPWLNLFAGARALSSGDNYGADKVIRSVRLTEYGPVLGLGLTF